MKLQYSLLKKHWTGQWCFSLFTSRETYFVLFTSRAVFSYCLRHERGVLYCFRQEWGVFYCLHHEKGDLYYLLQEKGVLYCLHHKQGVLYCLRHELHIGPFFHHGRAGFYGTWNYSQCFVSFVSHLTVFTPSEVWGRNPSLPHNSSMVLFRIKNSCTVNWFLSTDPTPTPRELTCSLATPQCAVKGKGLPELPSTNPM